MIRKLWRCSWFSFWNACLAIPVLVAYRHLNLNQFFHSFTHSIDNNNDWLQHFYHDCWCCLLLYQPILTISFCWFYVHLVTLSFFLFLSYSFDSFLLCMVLFSSEAGFFSYLRQGSFCLQGWVHLFPEKLFFSFFIGLSPFVHFPNLLFFYGSFLSWGGVFFHFGLFYFKDEFVVLD